MSMKRAETQLLKHIERCEKKIKSAQQEILLLEEEIARTRAMFHAGGIDDLADRIAPLGAKKAGD